MLNEFLPRVPTEVEPLWFDLGLSLDKNLNQISAWSAYYQDHMPLGTFIDEASVLVPLEAEADIHEYLVDTNGWERFNTASDTVFTNPFSTRYRVHYAFYRHPAVPYRMEVMVLGDEGFSPLHQALDYLRKERGGPDAYAVPHLSFKPVPRGGQSLHKAYAQAVDYIRSHGGIHAQTCQSTYGSFGYYIGNDALRQVYLKPRVNLRDVAPDVEDLMRAGVRLRGSDVAHFLGPGRILAECGQPYPCAHNPDGGNHPVQA